MGHSHRLSRPASAALVCAAITLASWGAILWGLQRPGVLSDVEGSPQALAIGLGVAPGVIAPMMMLVYLRGVRAVRAARHGDQVLGRWTVSASELAEFAINDAARNALGDAYRNIWTSPAEAPAKGIEIIFVPDAVLVGGRLFPLVTTGAFRFDGMQVLPESPLAIEFRVFVSDISDSVSSGSTEQVLRLPVSRLARSELANVLEHFRRVDARELIVNPNFFLNWLRAGLIAAPLCFVISAWGFWLSTHSAGEVWLNVLLLMTVGGLMGGLGALAISAVAWMMHRAQVAPRER